MSTQQSKVSFLRSLRGTLIILFLSISLIPLISIGAIMSYWISAHLHDEAADKLKAVRNIKAIQINQYIHERLKDVENLSSNPSTVAAMQAFEQAIHRDIESAKYGSEHEMMDSFRHLYLRKPDLIDAKNDSQYNQIHAQYHNLFRKYQQDYGYYDIFLIEPHSGTILYSVFKEDDYGTSLRTGKYANSNLANGFQAASTVSNPNFTRLEDFAPYAPSNHVAAAFVTSPIFSNSKLIGVLAFQLSIDSINNLMQESTGMGETGETLLVSGDDYLLRSNSRFFSNETILRKKIESTATQEATAGRTGVQDMLDYQGKETLAAYMPLTIPDVNWLLIAKMDKKEINEIAETLQMTILTFVLICAAIVVVLALFFSNTIAAPIIQMTQVITRLAAGEINQEIEVQGRNEIGLMTAAFHRMTTTLRQIIGNTGYFLEQLSQGQTDLKVMGDYPGNFVNLKIALEGSAVKLDEVNKSNSRQNWIKTGHAHLNEKLRGEQNVILLSKNIVDFFATYLDIQVGILYLIRDEGEETYLQRVATYGFAQQDDTKDFKFHAGEGLVGQVMLERQPILRTLEPEEYTHMVQSGLAQAVPKHIFLLPFMYEDEVKGVVELGTSKAFSTTKQDFLTQAMPSIGIAINTAESRTKMQMLLTQSQEQAELLQRQKAEMQQTNEELTSQTEELQSQQEELQSQQEELRQTNETLEERSRIMARQQEEVKQKNHELETAKVAMQTKAEELELASKYKSEFLANMSHELRTPLNSLLILAQLLAENKEETLTDKQIDCANTIHSAGTDLLNLINDILDLSKVEAGKIEIHPELMPIGDLVHNIQQKFQHVAENKGLWFKIQLADHLPDNIYSDTQRLHQIINNLLSNAFKFTEQGGVTLDIKRPDQNEDLSRSGLDVQSTVLISVTDTGVGIPLDKQKVIFEAFQQADGTTSRRFGGTGLGLSISRQLAQLMGGEIKLHSEHNQGSCFSIFLPEKCSQSAPSPATTEIVQPTTVSLAPKPSTIEKIEKIESQPIHPSLRDDREDLHADDRTLLIIEDDDTFARALMDLAREKAFKCLRAADGKQGLALAEQYLPSAIMLDVGLPQLDGWSVMEQLKDNSETRHIPVHFVSGGAHHQEAKKMGAIGYALKPVSMAELGEAFTKIEDFINKTVKKLLLLTDSETHKQSIIEIVDNEQVDITTAQTSVEAQKQLLMNTFECMVLDVSIEQDSGIALLNKLSQESDLLQIPIVIYTERELSEQEEVALRSYSDLTVKAVRSPERLLDEATLFLHEIESHLPEQQRQILRMVHDKEAHLQDKKVLLVDDDARNVFALTAVLEDKGMEVFMASNGKLALDELEQMSRVDMILMDIMMPEMDGFETIRCIREQDRYRKVPIIALTAKAMKGDANKCIEAGANDYLSKPVDTDKLLSLMRVWIMA
ncbi:response regulator [Candidatus Albibeggiatoa sp. nov. NOAA]|uniref:response regulator n=1 Tax=Candidatus Albibeggiatoa sp. nov. NOAA TaxID=3162724 RepID=UPI0032FE1B66|nr:response regulator [Thiotrichaceae bacterium]